MLNDIAKSRCYIDVFADRFLLRNATNLAPSLALCVLIKDFEPNKWDLANTYNYRGTLLSIARFWSDSSLEYEDHQQD